MAKTLVNLAEQVSGTLPLANGGTGATSLSGAGIEQTANKGAANGYAGLNSSGLLATSLLGTGTANSTTFLAGNNTWAVPPAPTTWSTTTSSASTLTLAATNNAVVFTGTTATWTLPAVSGNTGNFFHLESRGSGNITLNAAGTDHIWWKSSVTSMTIAPSGSLILVCDGTYWNALSNDLVNNSVGILPTANGGTGNATGLAATATALATGRLIQVDLTSTAAPSFNGTANVTPGTSGLLPVSSGGTGLGTLTSGSVLVGAGTSSPTLVAPGASGNVLTSNGSTWTSAAASGASNETVQALGTVGSTKTIPALTSGTMMTATLTSATPCTFTMPTAAAGASFALLLNQPASGTVTSATFTGVDWPAVGAPTITASLGATDLLTFMCFDGSTWQGSYVQGF